MLQLHRHEWVVYAKPVLDGPATVLDYLSRYTHCTAIGRERLITVEEHSVRTRVRAHADGLGRKRGIAIDGEVFVGRLMQQVLPSGFKRIRHFGLLALDAKPDRLSKARQLLGLLHANPVAREQTEDFMRRVAAIEILTCPHCTVFRRRMVEQSRVDLSMLSELVSRGSRGRRQRRGATRTSRPKRAWRRSRTRP